MPFVAIPVGIVMLAAIIYLAVSKKSSFKVRIVALAALALMIVTVIICLFLIFGVETAPKGPFLPDAAPVEQPPPAGNSSMVLVGFLIFLIALFLVVAVFSLRENKRAEKKRIEDETK